MADQNDSPRENTGANLPDQQRTAEVVDAEVVESEVVETEPPRRQKPAEDEEYRQYQQFLEFQRFREWQRTQDGEVTTTPPPATAPAATPKKPWWKHALRLLRFKLIRRLIYLVLVLLLLNYAIDYYFGGSGGSDQAGTGGSHEEHLWTNPIRQTDPVNAVRTLYDTLATEPHTMCEKFDPAVRQTFARNNQSSDCDAAVRLLGSRITNPMLFKNPSFNENAGQEVKGEAVVRACETKVSGGPNLGDFKLRREPTGGWIVIGHANAPATCG